jgi:hypothetical protein
VLEFLFVDVDWYVCSDEVLETAGVVEMEMPEEDGLHVLDVVACCFNRVGELVLFFVDGSWEDVSKGGAPFLCGSLLDAAHSVDSDPKNGLTTSISSAHPVSNKMTPTWGWSIRIESTTRSRRLFSGFLLLLELVFAPLRSLPWQVSNPHRAGHVKHTILHQPGESQG